MRAAVVRRRAPVEERPVSVEDVDRPNPGPGEVLIEVEVCGLCRTDLHVVEGDLESRLDPVIPGHQIVGRVVTPAADGSGPVQGTRVGVAWLGRTCGARPSQPGQGQDIRNNGGRGWD